MSDEVVKRKPATENPANPAKQQQLLTKIRNWRLKKNRSRNQLQK